MSNINSQWKKFVAVGCSHGMFADPAALKAVLAFCEYNKPEIRIHLGDFTDQAAFRSGAHGTKDEAASIKDDLASGLRFLQELRPTILMNGNHEIRLWKMAEHHNEILARAAQSVINEIKTLANKMECRYVEDYNILKSWVDFGDHKLLHGFMFSEYAIRKHAEHFGNCIIAHLHTPGVEYAKRCDSPVAYCVGTLANIEELSYAHMRQNTSRWGAALVYGETNGKETHPQLCRLVKTEGGYRPIL